MRAQNSESGAAFVEFAVIFPLLLLIVFGIIQFGLLLNASITLNNAAEVAARYATLANGGASDAEILSVVEKSLEGTMLDTASNPSGLGAIDYQNPYTVGGQPGIKVGLQYSYPLIIPYVVGSSGTFNLNAKAIMD